MDDENEPKELQVGWLGRRKPLDEALEGSNVSPVVLLCILQQVGPCEIRVLPWPFSANQILWGSHHFVLFWAHKENQRSPLLVPVHHCPMQAALVSPIR